MALETTSTALTEIVNSEIIADVIMYGADASVIAPTCRVLNLEGRGSGVASFPQWELDATESITEGTTTLSNVQLQTTEVATITAAQIGVLREVTDYVGAVNVLGKDELMRFCTEDGARLCFLDLENDLAALLSGFTTTVGTSGSDFSVANFIEAVARVEGAKLGRGPKVCILDDQQAFDLRSGVAASTGTVFANASQSLQNVLRQGIGDGFVGEMFDVPIWQTNLTDTANTGADVVGALYVDGSKSPQYAALGMAALWMPRVKILSLPDQVADQLAVTAAWGVGRISDFGVDITTDA